MAKSKTGIGRTALVTGASSGIGKELAVCFAKNGFNLVLVARSPDKLKVLAEKLETDHGIAAWVVPADLAKPGSAEKLAKEMIKQKRPIDALVNCAGILEHNFFFRISAERHQELIDLNISALTAMLGHFLPPMVERGFGRILNVASISAFQPLPSLATYAATKAYVLSLTESLSEELKGTGVSITALCPGITATNMMSTTQESSPDLKIPDLFISDPIQVAEEGFKSCMKGEVIKVPGIVNRAGIWAGRATPKWLLRRVTGKVTRSTVKSKK